MKYLIPVALAALILVGCDKDKAAINDNNEATKTALDNQKKVVDAAAVEAKKQADVDAAVEKAKIEEKKVAVQAQLGADKKKADALAEFEKAKVDAQRN